MPENHWSRAKVRGLDPVGALVYRSNLLGREPALVNFGGGNTSTKTRERDHAEREVDVLWIKGSGSDLATTGPAGFAPLRLADLLLLRQRDVMSD